VPPHPTPSTDDEKTLPLSVSIVCRDNERTIGRTLDSVRALAREVVAVDSGSTDATLDLLERAGARVIGQEWLGHIRQKQFAMEQCAQPWILHLDSDESLEPDLRASVRTALERDDPDVAGYEMNRKVWWGDRFLHHAWQPEWRLRLVRRGRAKWGGYDPHDALEIVRDASGPARVERLRGDMRHESFFTMAEHLRAQVRHAEVAARSYRRLGRRASVLRLTTSPAGAWLKQMVLKQAWRDGWRGWCAASATGAATLMKHLALLELERSGGRSDAGGRPIRRGREGGA